MDKADAIARLDGMEKVDNETVHLQADGILLAFLRANGHADIADAYKRADERVGFWYA